MLISSNCQKKTDLAISTWYYDSDNSSITKCLKSSKGYNIYKFGITQVADADCQQVKPQSHIHGFGPGRATVHPDLASR